jgi:hypothetical protein
MFSVRTQLKYNYLLHSAFFSQGLSQAFSQLAFLGHSFWHSAFLGQAFWQESFISQVAQSIWQDSAFSQAALGQAFLGHAVTHSVAGLSHTGS